MWHGWGCGWGACGPAGWTRGRERKQAWEAGWTHGSLQLAKPKCSRSRLGGPAAAHRASPVTPSRMPTSTSSFRGSSKYASEPHCMACGSAAACCCSPPSRCTSCCPGCCGCACCSPAPPPPSGRGTEEPSGRSACLRSSAYSGRHSSSSGRRWSGSGRAARGVSCGGRSKPAEGQGSGMTAGLGPRGAQPRRLDGNTRLLPPTHPHPVGRRLPTVQQTRPARLHPQLRMLEA